MTPQVRLVKATKYFSTSLGLKHTVAQHILRKVSAEPRHYIFEELDFAISPGESIAILGANGTGKSTLLRCIAGTLCLNSGSVEINGKLAAILSHGFGAYEELPVKRNILLAQLLLGTDKQTAEKRILQVAETAGLRDRVLMPTAQCSEGMRAKIALSALIHTDFQVALLDETLSHVDADFREIFQDATRRWIKAGRSIVFTSHDENLPGKLATRSLRFQEKNLIETSQISG